MHNGDNKNDDDNDDDDNNNNNKTILPSRSTRKGPWSWAFTDPNSNSEEESRPNSEFFQFGSE